MIHQSSTRVATISTFILLLICSATALGSSEDQPSKSDLRAEHALAALSKMTDADSLAAAGLMSANAESLAFLARATAVAPDRADLNWLRATRCAQSPPCDPQPIQLRLRELDPANGAGWWSPLARAGAAHDSDGLNTALMQQPGRTEACRGVAKALQNGDTYLTEMIGVAIAKRVWPEDSPEWKTAAEERRVYEYRSKLYPKLEQRALTYPEAYLNLCAQNRREQDVFAAQLSAAGYDPDPHALESATSAVPGSK